MSRRNSYDVEIFKKTATWAEQIVSRDKDFQDYAGAPMDVGHKLAMIDTALRYLIKEPKLRILLKLYRAYLIQEKKAFFSGVLANQITMLAFLKGGRIKDINAILRTGPGSINGLKPRVREPDIPHIPPASIDLPSDPGP